MPGDMTRTKLSGQPFDILGLDVKSPQRRPVDSDGKYVLLGFLSVREPKSSHLCRQSTRRSINCLGARWGNSSKPDRNPIKPALHGHLVDGRRRCGGSHRRRSRTPPSIGAGHRHRQRDLPRAGVRPLTGHRSSGLETRQRLAHKRW